VTTLRNRSAVAFTAAAALAIGMIPAALTSSSILAAGEERTTVDPGAVQLEPMVLTTDASQGTVSWNGITETFTGGQQCEVQWPEGEPTLLELTGSITNGGPAVAGFRDGQIGIYEPSADGSPTNASQCFRVDAESFELAEVLTVSLGDNPSLTETFGSQTSPILAKSATITYAVQSQSGTFDVTAGDSPTAGSPVSWGEQGKRPKPGTEFSFTIARPDGELFSTFSLEPALGSFSLTSVTLDLYSQADANLCTPGSPNGSNTISADNAEVVYLGNGDQSANCFSVLLDAEPTEVVFRYPLDQAPATAQFLYTIDWTTTGSPTPSATLPAPWIDFEIGDPNETELPFCPDDLYEIVDGQRVSGPSVDEADFQAFNSDNQTFPDFDVNELDGGIKQYACVDTRSAPAVSLDTTEITDTVFVIGDARMRL
jgi:hypothetical protein